MRFSGIGKIALLTGLMAFAPMGLPLSAAPALAQTKDADDLAKVAVGDQPPRPFDRILMDHVVPRNAQETFAIGDAFHLLDIGNCCGHRFFNQYVLAGFERHFSIF